MFYSRRIFFLRYCQNLFWSQLCDSASWCILYKSSEISWFSSKSYFRCSKVRVLRFFIELLLFASEINLLATNASRTIKPHVVLLPLHKLFIFLLSADRVFFALKVCCLWRKHRMQCKRSKMTFGKYLSLSFFICFPNFWTLGCERRYPEVYDWQNKFLIMRHYGG